MKRINMSSFMIFSPQSFNLELILNSVELYSLTILNFTTSGAYNNTELLVKSQFSGGHTFPSIHST